MSTVVRLARRLQSFTSSKVIFRFMSLLIWVILFAISTVLEVKHKIYSQFAMCQSTIYFKFLTNWLKKHCSTLYFTIFLIIILIEDNILHRFQNLSPESSSSKTSLLWRQTSIVSNNLYSVTWLTLIHQVVVTHNINTSGQLTSRSPLWHLLNCQGLVIFVAREAILCF